MGNSVITMRGLCKSYQKQEVLHDFSLTVERGHICGLIGPNGAGKTTIMKILAGLFFPTKGKLLILHGFSLDKRGVFLQLFIKRMFSE